jgi:hypothetical protein
VDPYATNRETGSFILIDSISNNTVAAGLVIGTEAHARTTTLRSADLEPPRSQVSAKERRARFGASDGVVLLAGAADVRLDALAYALERRLFDCGAGAVVLARGADPSFSAARILADAGILALVDVASQNVSAARAELEGRRVLVVAVRDSSAGGEEASGDLALDVHGTSIERAADALLDSLRERGWVGH